MNPEPAVGSWTRFGPIAARLLDDHDPWAVFVDLERLFGAVQALRDAFPSEVLHAAAIKANPLSSVLRRLADKGVGLEAASEVELELALRHAPPSRVLYDSPSKTDVELGRALSLPIMVNLDNLQELERAARLLDGRMPVATVGLRVNPNVGSGTIEMTSTARRGTKFGVCLSTHLQEVHRAFVRHDWLKGVHVHVGSGGCGHELLARGAAAAVQLAEELGSLGRAPEIVNIGGGLPMPEGDDDSDILAFGHQLQEQLPGLFSGPWRVVTEYGRRLHGPTGLAISRVQATKMTGGRQVAIIHFGADLMLRTAYQPDSWPHRISVWGPDGTPKSGEPSEWDVAGPLCFSGDLIARARSLPAIEPGDLVVVHDVGAYTLSMWSKYNSRRAPSVWGIAGDGEPCLLRRRDTVDDVLGFWADPHAAQAPPRSRRVSRAPEAPFLSNNSPNLSPNSQGANMAIHRLLILTTGGTIAGNVAGKASDAAESPSDFSHLEALLSDTIRSIKEKWGRSIHVKELEISNEDSSNIKPTHWAILSAAIADNYEDYDGFVITHGTNTMGYTCAALSFALGNLGKPVVVTGSQVPFGWPGSDAKSNLDNAVRIAAYPYLGGVRGVVAVFGSHIITGTRAKKATEFDYDAFQSFSAGSLGRIGRIIQMNEDNLKRHHQYLEAQRPQALRSKDLLHDNRFDARILSLTEFPGLDAESLLAMVRPLVEREEPQLRGLIFRAFGAGDPSTSILPFFRYLKEHEIPVVMTTQAPNGVATMWVNEPGQLLRKEDLVIPAFDMSMEAMTTKLMWLVGQGLSYREIKRNMEIDLHGEITVKQERP